MISNSLSALSDSSASVRITNSSSEGLDASLRNESIKSPQDTTVISPLARQLAAKDAQSNVTTQNTSKGMSIVNQRLYGGQANAPVLSPRTDFNNASSPTQFLTLEDRKILGEMYDFAQQEGAELHHVDAIAISLGAYRSFSDGKIMGNFNSGLNSDLQGHVLTVDFSEKDAAIAARIRNSDAINSTKIDRGFLDYSLDPGFGALCNSFDLGFMEQMVNKFSNQDAAVTLDARFAKYEPTRIEQKVRYTKSAEVVFPPSVADYASVDGVGHWRTPELAAAAEGQNSSSPNKSAQITELIKSVLEKIRTSDSDNLVMLHRFEASSPAHRFILKK